ncbi:MAG: basic amino acid ABC transporter substrate-binding protein [Firmicutes bacterium]|nr:basic amino acid ABC transporter substrate-binding protein [Bacillota bacterium]
MKRSYLYLIIVLLVVVALVIVFTNKPQQEAARPVLRVGTDAAYEPFEYIDEDGNFAGFDIELITMIAEEMGRELELQNVQWDGIIPGLMNGNYDCLISAMTITEERMKQINFSDPYFTIKQAIVVREDDYSITGPADLAGKTIAVQNGTTGDLYASQIEGVRMKRFDTNPQAIQELLNKNADAAVMDDLVAYQAIAKMKGLRMIEIADAEVENYGIGVKKGNDELLAEINKALATLRENGKLDALIEKYRSM